MEELHNTSELSICLGDVLDLKINKVKPRTSKENIRVTQVLGSLDAKKILEKVADMKRK